MEKSPADIENGHVSTEFVSEKKVFGVSIETAGIERVPEDARKDHSIFANLTMWMSANTCISTFAIGVLGISVFQLGFWDSFATILIFNILGILPVCLFSTFGPKFGLRQMVLTRFSFGYYGAMLVAFLNIVACVGWSAVNVIVGAQILNYISHGTLPVWGGIILIAGLTTFVSLFGYKWIHTYEKYAFIPIIIIFLIIIGEGSKNVIILPLANTGVTEFGSCLAFGGAVYGFATGWCSYAADYNCNQPKETPSWKLFCLTFIGLFIPLVGIQLIGMAMATGLAMDYTQEPPVHMNLALAEGYETASVGGLLGVILAPLGGFGTFLLVLLAFSTVANNIPNDYSLGLSMQVFGPIFARVNRMWWTLFGAVVYIAISLGIYSRFAESLSDFLLVLAYWLAPYAAIVATDHFFIRKRTDYDLHAWNDSKALPLGIAGVLSLFVGFIGAILGMSQIYYTGVIAKQIGTYGGDVGFILAAPFAAIAFLILRPLEKRYIR
ncbi:hypothetical protein HK101_000902 [Irineochytrium annulatum]|nr:hypothetical protein HK101_000902 [Irineochytrium annulatum]